MMNKKEVVLSVAGSDCSGGAGIQADLKTMMAYGVYGMTAITAVTVQNTKGVSDVCSMPGEMVYQQMLECSQDIIPDAIKVGMLSSAEVAHAVADALEQIHCLHVVVDPVMVSTSGRSLLDTEAEGILQNRIFPLAELVTPNIPEAETLLDMSLDGGDRRRLEQAGILLTKKYHTAFLLKGGHMTDYADDVLVEPEEDPVWFYSSRIDCDNTHGTGCTLSSAIACGLAQGYNLTQSVGRAKAYLRGAMSTGLNLGQGHGPLDHGWSLRTSEAAEEMLSQSFLE